MEETKEKTYGIVLKDKTGYAMGDFASLLVFGLVTSILQIYYTDSLGLEPMWLVWLFLGARIWDAINDPMWARVVDSVKPTKWGRYRPWLIKGALPLAISAVLMFVKIPGLSPAGYLAYAAVTYVVFGMCYTITNIPYGSLASVLTTDEKEHSQLSIWRSLGSALGAVPALLLLSFCYTKGDDGNKHINYLILIIGVSVLAILSIVANFACFKMTKERVLVREKPKAKGTNKKILKEIVSDKTLMVISVCSMLFLAAQMFSQSYSSYLMSHYFKTPQYNMLTMVAQYLPMAVLMFVSGPLIKKFGKKEVSVFGIFFGTACYILIYLLELIVGGTNVSVWAYLGLTLLSGFGTSFFFLQAWAFANDAIDNHQVKTGHREDATCYAVYSFTRKLGQAVSAILVNFVLIWIGYDSQAVAAGSSIVEENTLVWMYNLSAIVPAVLYGLMGVLMLLFYPLNKKKLAEVEESKKELDLATSNEANNE